MKQRGDVYLSSKTDLTQKVVSSKVMGKVTCSSINVKPKTTQEPFKLSGSSSENTTNAPQQQHTSGKLFGLTQASFAPRCSKSPLVKKNSLVLSSEERLLKEIKAKGQFKARPLKKRLFDKISDEKSNLKQEPTKFM